MSKVSIFKSISEPDNPETMDLMDYLEKTRDGGKLGWEDITNKCRTIKDKEERDSFKRRMPTTTLSGTFSYRNDDSLLVHSGFLNIDLDDLDNIQVVKRTLERDKFVFSVFMSTGGRGLRVIFKIRSSKHRESFIAISQYLFERYDLSADPNGISPSKPYCVSFDPGLYLNPDETHVWSTYIKETVIKQLPDFVHTTDDFDLVLRQITGRGINICESYQDWLKVGFSLVEQFGEGGRGFFHDISRQSLKYKFSTTDKQYNQCIKAKGKSRANISTFYYFAKNNGINIASEQTKTIVRATKNGKRAGLKKEQIIENLKKFSNIEGADKLIEGIFESDIKSSDEEDTLIPQVEMYISSNYNLRSNEVNGFLEQGGVQLKPDDLNSIFISTKKIIPNIDYQLMMRLLKSDFVEKYNPFYEFFKSDGIAIELPAIPKENIGFKSPLIDMLALTIVNDDPMFTEYFLRKWMVGIISAIHKVHSPLLLCLLGPQNSGKTEFFRRLLPKELTPYYAESKLDKEKDDELLMTENILIMDDELGGKSKQDNQKLKNITSKQWFSLRRPYGDHNEKILRLAVLCGTSNFKEVLSDPTGNRRLIPISVTDIDKELYNSIDKKELFFEAYELYKQGFDWRITHTDIPYLNKNKNEYEFIIKERELISKFFEPSNDVWLITTEILVEIELLTRQKLSITNIGREMENLGFTRKSIRHNQYSTSKRWGVTRINRPRIYGEVTQIPMEDDNTTPKQEEPPF